MSGSDEFVETVETVAVDSVKVENNLIYRLNDWMSSYLGEVLCDDVSHIDDSSLSFGILVLCPGIKQLEQHLFFYMH